MIKQPHAILLLLATAATATTGCLLPRVESDIVKGPEIAGDSQTFQEDDGPERCRTVTTTPVTQEQTVTRHLSTPWLSQSTNLVLAGAGIGLGSYFFVSAANETMPSDKGLENSNVQLGLVATALGSTAVGLMVANFVRARDDAPTTVQLQRRVERAEWRTGEVCGPAAVKLAEQRRQEARDTATAVETKLRELKAANEIAKKRQEELKCSDWYAFATTPTEACAARSQDTLDPPLTKFSTFLLKGFRPGMSPTAIASDSSYRRHHEDVHTSSEALGLYFYTYTHTSQRWALQADVVECSAPAAIGSLELDVRDATDTDFDDYVATFTKRLGKPPTVLSRSEASWYAKWDLSAAIQKFKNFIEVRYRPRSYSAGNSFGSDESPFRYQLSVQVKDGAVYDRQDVCVQHRMNTRREEAKREDARQRAQENSPAARRAASAAAASSRAYDACMAPYYTCTSQCAALSYKSPCFLCDSPQTECKNQCYAIKYACENH